MLKQFLLMALLLTSCRAPGNQPIPVASGNAPRASAVPGMTGPGIYDAGDFEIAIPDRWTVIRKDYGQDANVTLRVEIADTPHASDEQAGISIMSAPIAGPIRSPEDIIAMLKEKRMASMNVTPLKTLRRDTGELFGVAYNVPLENGPVTWYDFIGLSSTTFYLGELHQRTNHLTELDALQIMNSLKAK